MIADRLAHKDYGVWFGDVWFRVLLPERSSKNKINTEPFREWLAERFHQNQPWNQLAHDLLTGAGEDVFDNPALTMFLSGSFVLKPEEVADLVEFPGVVAGFFDPAFLQLPPEVLSTTLVHHQHFFPVLDDDGRLREAFLAVVNTRPADERVIAKNAERVVTARLRDAKFFWDADRGQTLESRLDRLHTVVFHKKLGSYRDKAERIARLAAWIARDVFGAAAEANAAAQAARLAKADLTTDMVFEFPELQGTMGGIYAREEGLPAGVWKAIYYHYLPTGVEADAPPSRASLGEAAVTWAAVSLADKLDTVAGLTRAGERAVRAGIGATEVDRALGVSVISRRSTAACRHGVALVELPG